MDELMTTHTEAPRRARQPIDPELKAKTAMRFRQLLAERNALKTQAEYMRRVAVMLIPLVPKQTVTRILQDAKGENKHVGSR